MIGASSTRYSSSTISQFRRDPAAAFVIMMVTTVLLVPSSAAPAYHGSSSDVDIVDSWWYNACGHHSILHPQNKIHHNRTSDMQIFRIVKNQLKLFNGYFNQELKNIKQLYADVEPFDNVERKSFDWLPKYMKPTNSNRSKTALKEFHAELQYYVVAINYLEKLKLYSNADFDWAQRNEIFNNIFNNIKSLICEVEAGVNVTDQAVDARVTPDYPLQRGLATHFENLTQLKLQDTGVVYKLGEFTRKWNNNLMKRLPARKRESNSEDSDTMEDIDIPDEDENSINE